MCLEHPANAKEGYVFLSLLIWIKHSWADQAQFGQYLIRQLARVQWSQKGSVCSFRNDATTLLQPVNASTAWNQPCLKLPLTFNLALQAKMDTSDLSPSPGLNTVTWISLVRSLSMESPYKKSFFFFLPGQPRMLKTLGVLGPPKPGTPRVGGTLSGTHPHCWG